MMIGQRCIRAVSHTAIGVDVPLAHIGARARIMMVAPMMIGIGTSTSFGNQSQMTHSLRLFVAD